MIPEHTLTIRGYNLEEADLLNTLSTEDSVASLQRGLEAYEMHVVRNHVVSLPYNYWLKDNRIFSNQRQTIELELDEDERGGFYQKGILEALQTAKKNPNRLVFLYSPPGPASFDNPPSAKYAKDYDIGQLYLMFSDGDKIANISISLDKGGEAWLADIFGNDYLEKIENLQDQREIIKNFISRPYLSQMDIDTFLMQEWSDPERIVFRSNNLGVANEYSINDVLEEMKLSLTGQLKPKINAELIASRIVANGGRRVTGEDINFAYSLIIQYVMSETGRDEITLGGGCGGGVVRRSDLSPVEKLMETPNLSSSHRLAMQKGSSDSEHYEDYECPHCHGTIPGEKKDHPETWRAECPHCHGKLHC